MVLSSATLTSPPSDGDPGSTALPHAGVTAESARSERTNDATETMRLTKYLHRSSGAPGFARQPSLGNPRSPPRADPTPPLTPSAPNTAGKTPAPPRSTPRTRTATPSSRAFAPRAPPPSAPAPRLPWACRAAVRTPSISSSRRSARAAATRSPAPWGSRRKSAHCSAGNSTRPRGRQEPRTRETPRSWKGSTRAAPTTTTRRGPPP